MINIPLPQIIERISQEAGITQEEVKERIKKKLDELSGLISEEGAAHIVANELKVKFEAPKQELTIDKIQPGMRSLDVVGKIRAVYEVREFSSATRSGKVGNFLLTDKTGTTRVVLWNDQADMLPNLSVGDVVRITNAYARSNNDRVEVHLGHEAKIEKNPEGVEIDVDVEAIASRPAAQTKKIAELSAQDQNVTVIATIVQSFEPRFFAVCPECNSRAKEEEGTYTCPTHGTVTPTYNYVMNLFLDDGTDNVRCVLWRQQVEELLDKSHEELLALKDDAAAFEPLKSDLLGVIVKVRGRVQENQAFGKLELVAYEIEKDVEPETATAAAQETKAQAHAQPVTEQATVKTEETTVTAKVEDDKVTEMEVEEKEETKTPAQDDEEEVFTLDDIEDLEDLDE